MLKLKHFRRRQPGLPDLLNYGFPIDDGIVLCKDGSLLAGYFYRGPDLDSSPDSRLNHLSQLMNQALGRLHGGFTIWVDAVRMKSPQYFPEGRSFFPDRVSQMIEDERRQHFMRSGQHFQTEYALAISYMPPLSTRGRLIRLIYSGDKAGAKATLADDILDFFKHALIGFEDALSNAVKIERMREFSELDVTGKPQLRSALLNHLNFLLTNEEVSLNLPRAAYYLDTVLGGQGCFPGDRVLVGGKAIATVRIMGAPEDSFPGILSVLDVLPISLRFSCRFICLDTVEAAKQIKKVERAWRQGLTSFVAQMLKMTNARVDQDSADMTDQTGIALKRTNGGQVATGYLTPVVVITCDTEEEATEQARLVSREIMRLGFASYVDDINTMEAWLGSLPGHTVPNIRRPLIHSDNLADLLPTTSIWTGQQTNPCPFYPPHAPALLQAATSGAAPFWLNLHWGDVGHTLVFGPIGMGKSVLLAIIMAQARRYPGMRIWCFDKGRAALAMTKALGGQHYEVRPGDLAFCPASVLETDEDAAWTEEWVATCFELQHGIPPVPLERDAIHQAALRLRSSTAGRSLTHFWGEVQNERVKAAIQHYTIQGPVGRLLDAESDGLADSRLITFEMDDLMGMGEKQLIPVLLYLFRRFERGLTGQPALLLLDEAWIMLGHPVFREKIREWLKVLRKANCAVVLATQSLSDATRSGILDVLVESCPTKIFLPNSEADTVGTVEMPGPMALYQGMGLNETQVETIATAIPKKQYYVVSPDGCRLIDLELGPVALAFAAAGSRENIARILQLEALHGDEWPMIWLEETRRPRLVSRREGLRA